MLTSLVLLQIMEPEVKPVGPGGGGGKPGGPGGSGQDGTASPKMTREEDDEGMQLDRDIGEVFPVAGVSGKVVGYTSDKLGEIVVGDLMKGNLEVLFHVNQVQIT